MSANHIKVYSQHHYLVAGLIAGAFILCGSPPTIAQNISGAHPAHRATVTTIAVRAHKQTQPPAPSAENASPGPPFEDSHIPRDEWFLMTIGGRPVGFTHDTYAPAIWHGKRGWRFEEVFHLGLGASAFFNTQTVNYTRPDGSYLETTVIRDDPSGHEMTHITFSGRVIDCKATRITHTGPTPAISVRPVELTLPKGAVLAPQTPYQLAPADIKTGKVIRQWSLDNDKLQIQHQLATVGPPEELDLPGRGPTKVWKIRVHTIGDPDDYFIWVDSVGNGVKVSLPLQGAQLIGILTPYTSAKPHPSRPPIWKVGQEGTLTAVPSIRNPRDANTMDLSITGAPEGLQLPSDGSQTVTQIGPGSIHISIAMPGLPEPDPTQIFTAGAIPGPAQGPDTLVIGPSMTQESLLTPEVRAQYLSPSRLINSGAPEITMLAANLTRSAHTPEQKIRVLRDWVSSHVQQDGKLATTRNAAEVLHNPRGACRDYAILYAALARAAGIPTRVCAGIVYDSGMFWGHCWTESWIRRWGWIPVDPSMEGHFVDATHVKFAEGDAAEAIQRAAATLVSLSTAHSQLHIDWVQPESAR